MKIVQKLFVFRPKHWAIFGQLCFPSVNRNNFLNFVKFHQILDITKLEK
jgi:hypothetical protein